MKDFTAIILAAGQGTRLRPLTDAIPKCMVEVAGKPMFQWQKDALNKSGIEEIVVVTGYKEEKIPTDDVIKIMNHEYESTNMIYSLMCAEKYLNGNVIISYGDIVYSVDILNELINDQRDIVIASDEEWISYWKKRFVNPLDDAETFVKGNELKVISLGQKPENINEIEGQFIGLIKLSENGCNLVKNAYKSCNEDTKCKNNAWGSDRSLRNAYMTDLMNYFAGLNQLYYKPIKRGWFEVDDPGDLKIANQEAHKLF